MITITYDNQHKIAEDNTLKTTVLVQAETKKLPREYFRNTGSLTLLFKNNTLTLAKDGKTVISYDDSHNEFGPPHNTSGKVGLRMMKSMVRAMYDNIRLSTVK